MWDWYPGSVSTLFELLLARPYPDLSLEKCYGSQMCAHCLPEGSEAFSTALLSSLLELQNRSTAPVWQKAEKLFNDKVVELLQVKGFLNGSAVPASRP